MTIVNKISSNITILIVFSIFNLYSFISFSQYQLEDTYAVSFFNSPWNVTNKDLKPTVSNSQVTIEVYPNSLRQKMWGFGGSITESCFDNLYKLNKDEQESFYTKLFSKKDGAGLDFLRIPIGGNDFSRFDYTLNDSKEPDLELLKMNFEPLNEYITFIKKAQTINPTLKFMITPWSPPAWMKEPAQLRGGQLLEKYFYVYSLYLIKIIKHFEQNGIPINYLTILNEPMSEQAKYNYYYQQAYMSPQHQEKLITEYLKPLIEQEQLSTQILAHDHNWDNSWDLINILRSNTKFVNSIGGFGYHCYGGQFNDFINSMKYLPPEVPVFQTECSGIHKSGFNVNSEGVDFLWWLQNQVLDATRAGATGALSWNLCLDNNGNPHNGGCPNCRGLLTINPNENNSNFRIYPTSEWHALAQVSKFIDSNNTYKIDSTDTGWSELQNVALKNAKGQIVIVVKNPTYFNKQVLIKIEESRFGALSVPPMGAVSAIFNRNKFSN